MDLVGGGEASPRVLRGLPTPRRRPDGGLQFGAESGCGLVVDGLTEQEVRALRGSAGSRHRSSPRVATSGTDQGRDLDRVVDAVRALSLDPLEDRGRRFRRSAAYVLVDGRGPLPGTIGDQLRAAGVGQVRTGWYAADALLAGAGSMPDVVVLTAQTQVGSQRAAPLRARSIRHLPVTAHHAGAVVGPLVRPGGSACLRCLEHVRTDLDPSWPLLSAQSPDSGDGPAGLGVDRILAGLVAGLTAMVVLAELDGQCPAGVSLEVAPPWPRVVQRRWEPHPWCSCGAARMRPTEGAHPPEVPAPGHGQDAMGEWTA